MNSHGFTFIELLVSVAIMMVVSGGVIVNYNSYNDAQKIRQSTLTVKNNLRFAQSRAYNGEKPANGCTQLLGYQVTFTSTSYSTQARCSEGLAGDSTTVTLEKGLSFSPVPPTILFRVLTRGIDSDVSVKVVGFSRSAELQITRSGDFSDVTQVLQATSTPTPTSVAQVLQATSTLTPTSTTTQAQLLGVSRTPTPTLRLSRTPTPTPRLPRRIR